MRRTSHIYTVFLLCEHEDVFWGLLLEQTDDRNGYSYTVFLPYEVAYEFSGDDLL